MRPILITPLLIAISWAQSTAAQPTVNPSSPNPSSPQSTSQRRETLSQPDVQDSASSSSDVDTAGRETSRHPPNNNTASSVAPSHAPPPPVWIAEPPPTPEWRPEDSPSLPLLGLQPFYVDARRYGVHFQVASLTFEDLDLFGVNAVFRYRPLPRFAFDFGFGIFGGEDELHLDHTQVPVFANVVAYLNPDSLAQLYGTFGLSIVSSQRDGFENVRGRYVSSELVDWGGQAGVGLEVRILRMFAITSELKALLRARLSEYEDYARPWDEERDVQWGAMLALGALAYF